MRDSDLTVGYDWSALEAAPPPEGYERTRTVRMLSMLGVCMMVSAAVGFLFHYFGATLEWVAGAATVLAFYGPIGGLFVVDWRLKRKFGGYDPYVEALVSKARDGTVWRLSDSRLLSFVLWCSVVLIFSGCGATCCASLLGASAAGGGPLAALFVGGMTTLLVSLCVFVIVALYAGRKCRTSRARADLVRHHSDRIEHVKTTDTGSATMGA